MAKSYFKQEYDLEKRIAEAARLKDQYPDRIPMIVEKAERSDIPSIDKKKWYLVRGEMTVQQFGRVICKKIGLSAKKPIVVFMDNVLLPTDATMSAIYDEKKDEDGFLYVNYNTSQMLNVMDLMMDNPLLAVAYGIGVDSRKEWDVKEDENAVILRIPIPGFDKEEIKISVEQNMLVVKGEGGKESEDEEDDVRSFYSQVYIPPKLYKMYSIKAVMKNGVLEIKIPKVKEEEQEDFFEVMVD